MIELLKMGIADTALFKGQVFHFKPGISYIYGLNHSGRLRNGNGNAAGKSAFFSRMGELIYDEPVVGTKQDKVKKGKSFIEYRYNGQLIKIMSSFKGRTEQFTIWVDGKPSKYNTPTKAKAALKRLFPPTKDDFDSYIYLDSRVPHPLVRGSSIERKRFFTSFFNLDKIDAERKIFAAELAKLTKVRAAYNELARSFNILKADLLSAEEKAELIAQHRKLTGIHAKLSVKAERAQQVKQTLNFVEAAKDQVTVVESACGGTITEELFDEALKEAEWHVKNDEADLEHARNWEAHQEAVAEYGKAIAELGSVKDAEFYKEDSIKYDRALPKYRSITQQLADLDKPEELEPVEKPTTSLDQLLTSRAQAASQLEHAHKFEDGECYACGQAVKIKNPKLLAKAIAQADADLKAHKAYTEYVLQRKQNAKLKVRYDELKEQQSSLKAVLTSTKEAHRIYEALKYLTKPGKFEGKKIEVAVKERMLAESRDRLSMLRYCRPHLDSIIDATKLTAEDLALKDFDASRLSRLQDKLSDIRAKLAVHKSVVVRARDMKTRLADMEEQLKEEEPLKLLIKGYSDKAIKRMAIEAVSARLMQLINQYAQQVFPGYTFEFKWETQISILVHRDNGETSDVRKLSGAEAMIFTLILVPCLLAFTPTKKRVSAIIMDEPSASLSEATIQSFHALLPQINKLIPSIVVITPKAEERLAEAHNYTVLRTKNGATIIDGHPSEHLSK